jgi:hypothetical protein
MLRSFFYRWERRLASVDTDRVAQPFEWGLDWIPEAHHRPGLAPAEVIASYAREALADSDRFFDPGPAIDPVRLDEVIAPAGPSRTLAFPSAIQTPDEANNRVYLGVFPARDRGRPVPVDRRRAVLVLPQWNADAGGHVGLCRLIAWFGCDAFRISLPYHDRRKPPSHPRADFIVSANVGRTLQVCRQAVVDARRAIRWMAEQGYRRIGILGTSLGSCLSLLTTAHEPLIRAEALNHVSQYFADPVWEGLSTSHVRAGLGGHIGLDLLRRLWMPISPEAYLDRLHGRRTLLVYALYDLTFPLPLSLNLVRSMRARGIPFETAVLPCGHYTTGVAPFKYLDAYYLISFLLRSL